MEKKSNNNTELTYVYSFFQERYQILNIKMIVPDSRARTPSFGLILRSEMLENKDLMAQKLHFVTLTMKTKKDFEKCYLQFIYCYTNE